MHDWSIRVRLREVFASSLWWYYYKTNRCVVMGAMRPESKGDGKGLRAGFLVAFLSGASFSGGAWE